MSFPPSRPVKGLLIALAVTHLACATATTRQSAVITHPVRGLARVGWWQWSKNTFIDPFGRVLNVPRTVRRLTGHPQPASNLVDGAIPDSSFYANRDPGHMTPEGLRWGPATPEDVPRPPFSLTRFKIEGRTPGFFIHDADGRAYLFKFDPPGHLESTTGAEVAASKLLYALGYEVPVYEIVVFRGEDLKLPSGAVVERQGRRMPLTPERLARLLDDVRRPDGTYRVSASRLLPPRMLGSFSFKAFSGLAELRALKLAYAWVNNTDAKDLNTLMTWDGARVTGYLIDFGTAFGADPERGSKRPQDGWEYLWDNEVALQRLLLLGWHPRFSPRRYDQHERPFSPAVGLFSPRLDPRHWKPQYPVYAFKEMTVEDARWMARKLQAMTAERIRACVRAGRYSRQEDEDRIVEVLLQRRQAILNAYLKDRP
ncbi:MAG: hypothetical protein HY597_06235 [Candidatus Omnitrophica bacterium]|nr:hypothetical protein [Candidatus Omnitrophota bacterium]